MREKPLYLQNPDRSTITFSPMDFGIMEAGFSIACTNHGDGRRFSWIAGGGEHKYTISKMDIGYAIDDGTPASVWLFEDENESGQIEKAIVDIPSMKLLDLEHNDLPLRRVNELSNALIDLMLETKELDKSLNNLMFPVGHAGEFIIAPIRRPDSK